MTGRETRNERLWYQRVVSWLDPMTGLLVCPKTPFSEPVADLGDQVLTLYALVTAYTDSRDPALRDAICKLVDHLPGLYQSNYGARGFVVKSLMTCVRQMNYQPAFWQAALN